MVAEIKHYGYGTWINSVGPWNTYSKARVMCSDGVLRMTSWIAMTSDTFFSIPAHMKVKGKHVSGYVTIETAQGLSTETEFDPWVAKFNAYSYGKNASQLPAGVWRRQGQFTDAEHLQLVTKASSLGAANGRSAASWVTDGNTSKDHYQWLLRGIQTGDPEVMETLPVVHQTMNDPDHPDEWGLEWLMAELGIKKQMPGYEDVAEDLWRYYELSFSSAVEHEVERVCLEQLRED